MAVAETFRSRAMKGATLTNEEADALVGAPSFTQTAHGFSVGDVIRRSSAAAHTKAQADSDANIGRGLAVVIHVPDVNTFLCLRAGYPQKVKIEGHGFGAFGTDLFLSDDTAGLITVEANVDVGSLVYLGFVVDDDHIQWEPGWTRY